MLCYYAGRYAISQLQRCHNSLDNSQQVTKGVANPCFNSLHLIIMHFKLFLCERLSFVDESQM